MKKIWILSLCWKDEYWKINKISADYIKSIESTGLWYAIIIPNNTNNIDFYINECDCFIMPWWNDISPKLYWKEKDWAFGECIETDKKCLFFLEKMIKSWKKILWICKWMQLINIYFWWTLIQDIEHNKIHYKVYDLYKNIHNVQISENTILHNIFKKSLIPVNSGHHQAIDILWKDLIISWKDEENKYIEWIESKNWQILWVQWHPEKLEKNLDLFKFILSN